MRFKHCLIMSPLMLAAPAIAQHNPEVDARVETGILLNTWNTAIQQKDAHSAAALFSEDAVRVTPQGIVTGRADIEKSLEAGFKVLTEASGAVDQATILLGEGVMVRTGTWRGTYNGAAGPTRQKGFWSATLVRSGDAWKIHQETFNVSPSAP